MKQIIFFILLLTVVSYSQPIDTTTTGSGGLSKSEIESIIGDSTYALRLVLATQASVALKAPIASPTFTGTVTFPSPFTIGTTPVTTTGAQLNYLNSTTSNVQTQLNAKEGTITAGTALQYFRGDKTWATLNSTVVGLGNVTNESKTTMFTSPTFTSSVTLPATITIGSTALLPDITELNYLDNATSNIQIQLNAKVNTSETSSWDKNASDDVLLYTGTDSIHYGQDSIVVTHGVGSTPRFISLQLTSDSFGFPIWVSGTNSLTFYVRRSDVGLETITSYIKFKWMAYK